MRQLLVVIGFGVLVAIVLAAVAGVLLADDDDSPPAAASSTSRVDETILLSGPASGDLEGVTPGVAECRVNRNADAPFGLTFTRLLRTEKGLLAEWHTSRAMPPSGVVQYAIDAFDDGGDVFLQLAVKYLDDAQIAFFVFDFETASQTNLSGGAIRNGKRIEATFPQEVIGKLKGRFRWRAALSLEADDPITCPPRRDANPLGPTIPFPGR